MPSPPRLALALVACLGLAASASAQAIAGRAFVDLDADGIAGPGEAGIASLPVTLFGAGAGASEVTASDGTFILPSPAGCAGVFIDFPSEPDPATGATGSAWRRVEADSRTCAAPGTNPVGLTRYGVARHLAQALQRPSLRYIQLGDSIAAGVSFCFWIDSDYSDEVASELDCLGPGSIETDNRAVGGWESEDLLTPLEGGRPNPQFVRNVVAAAPDLVTISIGGNDFLATEGDFNASMQELISTRRSVQEILSVLVSGLPLSVIEINSVYDNEAASCATSPFHAEATPVWNQMLRHLAWGQLRPVQVAEVQPDFAHQDVVRGSCCGAEDQICTIDGIHPTESGAEIIQHALMESLGRVQVGPGGATGFDVGALPLAAVLAPASATIVAGGAMEIASPSDAVALDGSAARVGPGGVLEVSGFSLPPGISPARIIVGVRYRTTAPFGDDTHLFDASVLDFAPPQLTFTGWDTVTPIVGGSGRGGEVAGASSVNALPDVPAWRDVTAMLTLNAVDDGSISGSYAWPLPDAGDVANLKIRLSVNAVGAPDGAAIEWDGAWAWVYGASDPAGRPPGEVSGRGSEPLRVAKSGGVELSWAAEPLAETYRVWRGDIGAFASARCAPGLAGGCVGAPGTRFTEPLAPGNWFFLVSATNAAGDGPLGFDSFGAPESSSPPGCP